MKSVALHNLGCKVNAYEMDVMQQKLQENGYVIVPFDEVADVYIVNTCTVTNVADRKSRQMLHQARTRNPEAVVVAAGCYVQTDREAALLENGVDLVVGNNKKSEIAQILEAFFKDRKKRLHRTDISAGCDYEKMRITRTAGHTRAYVKIQDGCNQFCSYCIIPYARGRVRSRRFEDVREEMEELAGAGCREVVLTGIHISSYGIDLDDEAWEQKRSSVLTGEAGERKYTGREKLIELLERVQDVEGIERIRIGSLEPRIITRDAVARLAKIGKLCPHFHLSLQSGCDETLRRMNRHYTARQYSECVELLRGAFEHPAVTTDVIVGFPGETDGEFAQTYEFLQRIGLYEMHVFKYSARAGTRAAAMPDRVPARVQGERSRLLLALKEKQSRAFRAYYIGREEEVLFEETVRVDGASYQIGHTRQYVKAARRGEEALSNQTHTGKITGFLKDDILLME